MTQAESVETRYSWIIAVTAVTMLALAAGAPLTVVIGLVPISETLGSGRSLPSAATSLAYLGTGVGGVLCGLAAARLGQRVVAAFGGCAILAGLGLASLGQGGSAAIRMVPGQRVLGMAPNTALALLAIASFLCCVPMAMPAAHLVAFCGDLGIAASRGAAMLSVLLLSAFVARQFWGWLSDRIGGLWTVFAGSTAQVAGMLGFLATQDEAGLFFVAAAYGLGFGGIIPAYVLTVRELFPAIEASWRVPALLFLSLSGMAFGAWLAGAIYDTVGFYAAAWWAGIGFNIVQLALVGFLIQRQRAVSRP